MTMLARIVPAFVSAGLLIVAAACSQETIVLATVPAEDDAGTVQNDFKRCTDNVDCPGRYCQFDKLDLAQPTGHCAHRPSDCLDDDFHPVCAQSGISYYNDCYRRSAGASFAVPGECQDHAVVCDLTAHPCPTGATCALLGGNQPGSPYCGSYSGICWGSMRCPKSDDDDRGFRWDDCATGPTALRCVDTCTAVQSGRPFTLVNGTCK